MGSSNENQLVSRLGVLIAHLLKWQFQPGGQCRSWSGTIKEQRFRIQRLLKKNPSLKTQLNEAYQDGFKDSQNILEKETPIELEKLPKTCPYSIEQLLNDEFYPE